MYHSLADRHIYHRHHSPNHNKKDFVPSFSITILRCAKNCYIHNDSLFIIEYIELFVEVSQPLLVLKVFTLKLSWFSTKLRYFPKHSNASDLRDQAYILISWKIIDKVMKYHALWCALIFIDTQIFKWISIRGYSALVPFLKGFLVLLYARRFSHRDYSLLIHYTTCPYLNNLVISLWQKYILIYSMVCIVVNIK